MYIWIFFKKNNFSDLNHQKKIPETIYVKTEQCHL